ncbi:Holo-[acyl-carrier-protein] synthase [Jeotgalicoccus saudimassiliensis]|uniref:Holo-[acyl-carrier-protein] synthase n=1 Tax=Jeotgalicoccus saudimassiliensis TaxID=1461582 RepID=A0A078MD68_9STAP|nr:holo-ACP synthase [Jeotgalicoccus saudimassiliensis]CEA03387.1 Holo-[acyl-carrier-protein] synthase [Jeotgalicoccus saudimassiliensis]
MITGLGTDIIEISRVQKVNKDDRLAKRILTPDEMNHYNSIKSEERKTTYLAGRFAVKEAYSKALGTGIGSAVSFNDINCVNDALGKPSLSNVPNAHVSISHSQDYAVATVIIEEAKE